MKRVLAGSASRYRRLMQRQMFVSNPVTALLKRIYYHVFEHAADGALHAVDIGASDRVNSDELDLMLLGMKDEHFTSMGSDAPRVTG